MAIQTHLNYSTENITPGFPLIYGGSDFSRINNHAFNGGFDQFHLNLQKKSQQLQQRNENQQSMFIDQCQSHNLAAFVEKQKQETDRFIISQNERLRFLLQEQIKQQMEMISRRLEAKASFLLMQKDQEILKASKRRMELEALLQKMEMENQTWQRLAKQNEAMVAFLNVRLKEERERARLAGMAVAVEDEGSCCGGGGEAEGCLGGGKIEGKGEKMGKVLCRSCGSREPCVLLLPCRHLCCCRDCEAFLDSCPVCRTPKKASIEALIF